MRHTASTVAACVWQRLMRHHRHTPGVDLGQSAEHTIGHTVGTRAHHQPHHSGHTHSLLHLPQKKRGTGMSGRMALKIGQIAHRRILAGKKRLTRLQLLRHSGAAAGHGRESAVAAIDTAAAAEGAVAVGARSARVDRQLLHLARKAAGKIVGILPVKRIHGIARSANGRKYGGTWRGNPAARRTP